MPAANGQDRNWIKRHAGAILVATIGGVGTTVVVAAFRPLRTPVLAGLKWAWNAILAFGHHLASPSAVQWGLVYLGVALLAWAGWSATKRRRRRIARNPVEEQILAFTEMPLLGLNWRWEIDSSHYPGKIRAFCPNCDLEGPLHRGGTGYSMSVHCRGCGFRGAAPDGNMDGVIDLVRKEVQRRIRLMQQHRTGRPVDGNS